MLRPGGVARPALARAFTTKLSWAGSPRSPTLVMTEWLIVTYHCRTFTGWTGSLMGCEQGTQRSRGRTADPFPKQTHTDTALRRRLARGVGARVQPGRELQENRLAQAQRWLPREPRLCRECSKIGRAHV